MEIIDFANMTYGVLADTPFEDYIPTLCLPDPESLKIHALEGIPKEEEENMRTIVLDWAENTAKNGEEFLVAFRDGDAHFRVIRRFKGEIREALFPSKKA
jgi:hypothetical protein